MCFPSQNCNTTIDIYLLNYVGVTKLNDNDKKATVSEKFT